MTRSTKLGRGALATFVMAGITVTQPTLVHGAGEHQDHVFAGTEMPDTAPVDVSSGWANGCVPTAPDGNALWRVCGVSDIGTLTCSGGLPYDETGAVIVSLVASGIGTIWREPLIPGALRSGDLADPAPDWPAQSLPGANRHTPTTSLKP